MRTYSARPKVATMLTLLVILLVPVATLVGLLVPGFYRDTAWMVPQARGQDLVNLVVAEPLLIAGLITARRGRSAPQLIWLGSLGYLLYTYAMYSYTAFFNALFLVYVAIFSASLFAIFNLLLHLDVERLAAGVRPSMPARSIATFLGLVGVLFAFIWLSQIIPATLQGTVPNAIVLAKTPTSAVHVQDLAVLIPLLILAAIWLWQRRPWGFAMAGPLLVLADLIAAALPMMGFFSAQAKIPGALDMQWPFATLLAACLVFTALFVTHLRGTAPLDRSIPSQPPVARDVTPAEPRAR